MRDATWEVKTGTSDFMKSCLLHKNAKLRLNISHSFQVQEVSYMCHIVAYMLCTVTGEGEGW